MRTYIPASYLQHVVEPLLLAVGLMICDPGHGRGGYQMDIANVGQAGQVIQFMVALDDTVSTCFTDLSAKEQLSLYSCKSDDARMLQLTSAKHWYRVLMPRYTVQRMFGTCLHAAGTNILSNRRLILLVSYRSPSVPVTVYEDGSHWPRGVSDPSDADTVTVPSPSSPEQPVPLSRYLSYDGDGDSDSDYEPDVSPQPPGYVDDSGESQPLQLKPYHECVYLLSRQSVVV